MILVGPWVDSNDGELDDINVNNQHKELSARVKNWI